MALDKVVGARGECLENFGVRETLLSVATANQLELIGFWTLVAGLIGEIAILFVHHRPRLHNSLTVICVVAIIAGVWLERVGAEENRAPRKLRQVQREQIIRAACDKLFVQSSNSWGHNASYRILR